MVVEQSNIDHIMRGLQSTEGVRLHNHRKKLRQRFDIIKKLGQGTYGKVQLGINKETGQEVAIKTIKKCKIETEADLIRIRREIQIMSSVRHPNIIHIYEVFENREKMVLVMEYAAGGELYDYLNERKVLEEGEARRIFRQISTAVYYCHKHKICHRDLKLENILLDEHGSAKIADFGLSNVYDEKRLLQTFCGSPLYASPEIVRGTPYRGPEVDCWSLGVLLYTLVYGAMPFDGSNFKRLVKQISNGEYFEPKKPKASPASPLIKDMLTVDPAKRATVEQICSHWWVNQGFNVSCLDIAEDLANQTPVRLDLLLSLAPPPENSDKLVVTDEQAGMAVTDPPPRSMSVGSLLELNSGQEDRRLELLEDKGGKRKLETAPSETSMTKSPPKKKESRPEVDAPPPAAAEEMQATEAEVAGAAALPAPSMEVEVEGAAAAALPAPEPAPAAKGDKSPEAGISGDKPTRKSVKTVKKKVTKDGVEVKKKKTDTSPEKKPAEEKEKPVKKDSSRSSVPKDEPGKEIKREGSTRRSQGAKPNLKLNIKKEREKSEPPTPDEGPSKPTERRKSKIFETAEKFMSPEPKSPTVEKPKKVFIPGVKVSDFAKAFERKSSIPTSSTPVLKASPPKKIVPKDEKSSPKEQTPSEDAKVETPVSENKSSPLPKEPTPINDEKLGKLKDSARNVIANALNEEERKKVKKQILKPPVPKQKTEEGENTLENKKKAMTLQIGNEKAVVEVHTPEHTKFLFEPDKAEASPPAESAAEEIPKEKKTAKVNITLKSNTLPRRTTKAEILLASPGGASKNNSNFRTEVEHRVGDGKGFYTQRSEVAFPVSAAQKPLRSVSLEPENKRKERIIPIQFEGKGDMKEEARDRVAELERQDSQPVRGRPPILPYQRTQSQRSSSLSRQSTQDSDTESTMSTSGDPIRKSPREVIIPIAVEGGGYITPRATSLEPSESMSKRRPFPRRISLFSDNGSEDESSWRHDLEQPLGMLGLRSSRAVRSDRADSQSGSDDDEDDGFEILTAENLFSTLLSRVQNLTQKLNVDHGGRPGFPSARLSSQRLFGGFHEPLTRLSERSLSREMDAGRWPRAPDVSQTVRSVPRDRSRGRQHQGDVASISGSRSNSRTRDGRQAHPQQSYPDSAQQPYMRTWSMRDERHAPAHRSYSDNAHTYPRLKRPESGIPVYGRSVSVRDDPNRSSLLREDAKTKRQPSHSREPSVGEVGTPVYSRSNSVRNDSSQQTPTQEKPPTHFRSQSDSGQVPGPDFYEILAEKYGVVPARRYDNERKRRSVSREPKSETTNDGGDSSVSEKSNVPSVSPSRIKKESTPSERFQSPSEKLAAVLSQLEGHYEKKENKEEVRGIPNELLYPKKDKPKNRQTEFIKIENDRLKDLSPKALELYEKTLGLYQKTLTDKKKPKEDGNRSKQETPERGREDSFKNKKVKHVVGLKGEKENCELLKVNNTEGETPREDSPSTIAKKEKLLRRLSRELESEMGGKDEVTLRRRPSDASKPDSNLLKRLSRELEKEMQKDKTTDVRNSPVEATAIPEPARAAARTKIFTTLDKKLDLLRPSSEKKYLDKAIKSLQDNSAGPKDPVSENVLIKRAVSLSECNESKAAVGAIQSTVNSMLNFFKKSEDPSQAGINLVESSPPMLTPEGSPNKESKTSPGNHSPSNMSSLAPVNNSRRGSSSSFVSPDSESYDSWSNCSDFGTPDEVAPVPKSTSPIMRNFDDSPVESVGERIRRKSFYTRFNDRDRRKSRKGPERKSGEEVPVYKKSVTQNLEKARSPQPYGRSASSTDYTRKWYDDSRPRPFYKSEIATNNDGPYRKTSLDWSKSLTSPTFVRSFSQTPATPTPSGSSTLPRSFVGSYDARRPPIDPDRPFSPTRLRTPGRLFSPRTSLTPSPTIE